MKKLKAIDYIRKGWTQGTYARTKTGRPCHYCSPRAVKWCAIGAVLRAYSETLDDEYLSIRKRLAQVVFDSLPGWNDDPKRTKKEVIAAFKKAGI